MDLSDNDRLGVIKMVKTFIYNILIFIVFFRIIGYNPCLVV